MTTPTERRELLGRAVTACSVVAEAQDLCTRAEREAWHLVGDAFSALADAEDCEQVDDDRDELAGTVERLYDGIDAALVLLGPLPFSQGGPIDQAHRILTNLRAGQTPTAPAVPRIETAEAFWDYYTAHRGIARELLEAYGRRPAPCDCGQAQCTGWQMLYKTDRHNYGDGLNVVHP